MIYNKARFWILRLAQDSLIGNILHMSAQAMLYVLASRFRFRFVRSSAWKKKSDTLVILAGGRTANELQQEHWRELEQYDIVPLSFGALLPVSYDFFVMEWARPQVAENQRKLFSEISRRWRSNNKFPVCIWKQPENRTNLQYLTLPVENIITLRVIANDLSVIKKVVDMMVLFRLGKLFFFQTGGSLSAILIAARSKGYKRIVFVGVDLQNRHYFFDDNPKYEHIGLSNPFDLLGQPDRGITHRVAANFGDLSHFLDRLEASAGSEVQLLTSSRNSALAARWPIYEFRRAPETRNVQGK